MAQGAILRARRSISLYNSCQRSAHSREGGRLVRLFIYTPLFFTLDFSFHLYFLFVVVNPTGWLHPVMMAAIIFHERNRLAIAKVYSHRQVYELYKAMEARSGAVPRCTMVAGQIDLTIGGERGATTPMRKLTP